jgi:hypothetical protein
MQSDILSASTVVLSVEYKSSESYRKAVYLIIIMHHIYSRNYAPAFIERCQVTNSLVTRDLYEFNDSNGYWRDSV